MLGIELVIGTILGLELGQINTDGSFVGLSGGQPLGLCVGNFMGCAMLGLELVLGTAPGRCHC